MKEKIIKVNMMRLVSHFHLFTSNFSLLTSYFLLLTSILLLISCEESTKPETLTFSGTVTLEGETDYSGVKVSLYKPVILDTAIARINQQYPQIGVQISQETEFDHREHSPLYSKTTNASGSWIIENVTPGTYNVVAEKDSFGWRYIYETNESNIDFGVLLKAYYPTAIVNSTVSINNNQFIIIDHDVTFHNNSQLNLTGYNTILISPNKKLAIQGGLDISALNQLVITSQDINNFSRGIEINTNGQFNFDQLHISYLSYGITFEDNANLNVEIINSIVKNCTNNGIYAQNDFIDLKNNLIYNFSEYAVECTNDFNLQKNILLNSKGLILIDNTGIVKNNLFESNSIAITPYKGDIIIENNDFNKNGIAIAANSSDCEITFNNFINNELDIETNRTYIQYPNYEYSAPEIGFNNFFNSDTAINLIGQNSLYGVSGSEVGVNTNLNAMNCFWNTNINFNIEEKIIDANDESRCAFYVLYSPFEVSQVSNAGIQ